jgi:hypothetical protein
MEYLSAKIDARMVMMSNNNGYSIQPLLKIPMVATLPMHLTISPVIWKALLDPL